MATDRELTTRTEGPNSRASATAELNVLDNGAEMCTATTPSPSLSCNAWLVGFGELDGRRTGGGGAGQFVDVVGKLVDTFTQVDTVDENMQRHLADVVLFQVIWRQS